MAIVCGGCGFRKEHYFYGLCRWCYDNVGSGDPRMRAQRDEQRHAQDRAVCNSCLSEWHTGRDLDVLCGSCRAAVNEVMSDLRDAAFGRIRSKRPM